MGWTTPPKPLMLPEAYKNKIERSGGRPKYRIIKLSEYIYYIEIKTWYGWRKLKTRDKEQLTFRKEELAEKYVVMLLQDEENNKEFKGKKKVVNEFY